jgi:signal transduction histidine kinase
VLQVVDRNSRRLMALIEDLLTLSSVDSDGFALSVAPLDVMALVEGVHRAVLPSAASHGISLTVDVDPHAGILVADASQLDRALLNLLSNAIKFTPEGGQVSVRIRRDGRDRITFTVSDTGIGIPLDEQEQLFSRFFRSSTATERAIPGSGLGLAIVKTIVEEHGGTIAVESVPSIGTTVTFALPASAAPADRGRRVQRAVR